MRSTKPIMLIEDDQVDVMTVRRALKDLEINNEVVHAGNGEEALNYLKNSVNTLPCVIFLDMNMPKMNGPEFLEIAKYNPALQSIPVIILTSSEEEQDKNIAFSMSVAGYILKPVCYEKLLEAMNTINAYWTLSELPA